MTSEAGLDYYGFVQRYFMLLRDKLSWTILLKEQREKERPLNVSRKIRRDMDVVKFRLVFSFLQFIKFSDDTLSGHSL